VAGFRAISAPKPARTGVIPHPTCQIGSYPTPCLPFRGLSRTQPEVRRERGRGSAETPAGKGPSAAGRRPRLPRREVVLNPWLGAQPPFPAHLPSGGAASGPPRVLGATAGSRLVFGPPDPATAGSRTARRSRPLPGGPPLLLDAAPGSGAAPRRGFGGRHSHPPGPASPILRRSLGRIPALRHTPLFLSPRPAHPPGFAPRASRRPRGGNRGWFAVASHPPSFCHPDPHIPPVNVPSRRSLAALRGPGVGGGFGVLGRNLV